MPQENQAKLTERLTKVITGEGLNWSWGVDFYHACEYVSLLANTIFGVGTEKAQSWFREQRHARRHDQNSVKKVLASSAQRKRRHGLAGSPQDDERGRGYLQRYRSFMDYAGQRETPLVVALLRRGAK